MSRDLSLLALGFALATSEAALGAVFRLGPLMPNALLPIVIYLGMAQDISLARAAALSFVLGLFVDSAAGNAMGLMTFLHVATLIATRAAGVRLMMRGRLSQFSITALIAALGAIAMVSLRSIFRPEEPFEATSVKHVIVAVLLPSLTTGAVAPFVFQLVRRIDTRSRRDEVASLS